MKYFIYILFVLFGVKIHAQTLVVKDSKLAQVLCQKHPEIMANSCLSIDTAKAGEIRHSLNISGANVTLVDEIFLFNRIDTIVASGNKITKFLKTIQPSNFWNLSYLDISNNQIDTFPLFSINTSFKIIKYFYLQNNKAANVQKFWKMRDSIRVLDISGNYISDVEDYTQSLKAEKINLSNNYLTFEDLIPQTKHLKFSEVFVVSPQREIKWLQNTYTKTETDTFSLVLPIDKSITSNTYKWYKNGVLSATTTVNKLFFSKLSLQDAGEYSVVVTNSNSLLSSVILQSEKVQLKVSPCMDVNTFSFDFSAKCYGALVSIDTLSISGGIPPFEFYFINSKSDTIKLSANENKIVPDQYKLLIKDAAKCVKEHPNAFPVYPKEGCDEFVLTPDGDGLQDEYYFEQKGKAQIFNQFGTLVRELELPGFWNAKDKNGKIVPPGKYVLIINKAQKVEMKIVW